MLYGWLLQWTSRNFLGPSQTYRAIFTKILWAAWWPKRRVETHPSCLLVCRHILLLAPQQAIIISHTSAGTWEFWPACTNMHSRPTRYNRCITPGIKTSIQVSLPLYSYILYPQPGNELLQTAKRIFYRKR